MARVLVTGMDGFTGRTMAQALLQRGHEVIGTGRKARFWVGPDLGFARHELDLANLDAVRALIAEVQPERVVHLAGKSFIVMEDAAGLYGANLIATRNLLQGLADRGRGVESVLLASSGYVYGDAREGCMDESQPPLPANDYAVSKLAMEHIARLFAAQLPCIIARPFTYTGPGQSARFLIPKVVDHARRGATALELGNLDVARDFSDVRTVADCYARLLDCPKAVGGTFNVCSGQTHTLREVVAMVERLAGIRFDVTVNPAFVRANEVRTLWGSPARLEAMIGPVDRIPLEETIRWMLEA